MRPLLVFCLCRLSRRDQLLSGEFEEDGTLGDIDGRNAQTHRRALFHPYRIDGAIILCSSLFQLEA
jgi:hypothetical protein